MKKFIGMYKRLVVLMAVFALGQMVFASNVFLSAGDVVAGNQLVIRVEDSEKGKDKVYILSTPSGKEVYLLADGNQIGKQELQIPGSYLTRAGIYGIRVVDKLNLKRVFANAEFKVLAGEVDVLTSVVDAGDNIFDLNKEETLKVRLVDKYENGVEGSRVKLIVSSKDVEVKQSSGFTDKDGVINFTLIAKKEGVFTVSALDLSSENLVGESKTIIVGSGNFGIKKASAQESGSLAKFEIGSLPVNIVPNQNVSFKVRALDRDNNLVQNYVGKVRFFAEGENSSFVNLPQDYEFKAEDLGEHQFNLGLSFSQDGIYKILVSDANDKNKIGEVSVVVNSNKSKTTGSSVIEKVVITQPLNNTKTASTNLVLQGNASSNVDLKVFDGDLEVGSVKSDTSGKFSLTLADLSEGEHKFSVGVVNGGLVSDKSEVVSLVIDKTPPKVDEVVVDPKSGVQPSQKVTVKVYSEKNLSQAAVVFNQDVFNLNPSLEEDGLYIGEFQAPLKDGNYDLDVLLVDELGNEQTYKALAQVNVVPVASGSNPPSKVLGVVAYGSDQKVTLVWQPALDNGKVLKYKIYYGEKLNQLDKMAETVDNKTNFVVMNLENGKEYYFQIAALDDENNLGVASDVVSAIALKSEVQSVGVNGNSINNLKPAAYDGQMPGKVADTGPEFLAVVGASLAAGVGFRRRK